MPRAVDPCHHRRLLLDFPSKMGMEHHIMSKLTLFGVWRTTGPAGKQVERDQDQRSGMSTQWEAQLPIKLSLILFHFIFLSYHPW